jgi:aldose sugar dehydrogenase
VMSEKNSRRQTLRRAWLSGFLLMALPAAFSQLLVPVTSSQSRMPKHSPENFSRESRNQSASSAAKAALLNLPLSFEPGSSANQFFVRGSGYRLMLTSSQATIAVDNHAREKLLSMKLLGANTAAKSEALNPLPGKRNYIIGDDPAQWRTDVPTFAGVRYDEVYPGISVLYYGRQDRLEYDFKIAPGADPRAIRFAFNRDLRPRIAVNGDLVLQFAGGELREPRPTVYQEIAGERQPVAGRYLIAGKREVAFEVGAYDQTLPLVIDPVLVYSTYLGGSGDDLGSSIAIDSSNNVYLAGTTNSVNFPTQGSAFPNKAGLSDIFVTKINASGSAIIYSTYVGGSGQDRGDGLAIDGNGNAYVVGRVDSSSTNFPVTPLVIGPTYRGGDFDGVAFKLNAQGNALVYSTYIGGEDNDSTEGIAVDSAGSAYLTGGTRSQGFPITATGYQFTRSGDTDAYLMRLNSTATGLMYSTFLGGGGTDRGSGVAIDGSGNAYVAGYTGSADFPTESAFQNSFGGSFDAFIAKIDTNSSGAASLVFSTYLGGIGDDKAYGIAIDSGANNVYVVGQTSSNNLPLSSPAQPAFGGSFDAFIAKISSTGTKIYTTYLGGTGDDRGAGVAVNSSGEVYVTGFTSSTNFPTVNPLQIANGGGFDAFVAKLNSAGSAFLYSTYLGGSANENNASTGTSTNPIALDSSSNAYITGYTASSNFPTSSPLQPANGGGQDAFVAKISDAAPAADYSISISPGSRTVLPGGATTYTVTATPVGGFMGTISLGASGFSNDSTASFNPTAIVITDAAAKASTLTVTTTAATPPGTYSLNINTTSGNLQHAGPAQLFVSGTASANLAITKTASPNPATSLANLTYRIVVTNNGPSPATNVAVTDQLAAGPAFVSAIPTQGMCSGPPTITCNLGPIANGAVAIVNITITPQTPGQLTNTASVVGTESDPDTNDNSTTIQTTVNAPASGPSMLDPNLSVKTVVTGLSQPTSMAFIGHNDFFVLEKNTGKVQRVTNGAVQSTVLDLAVNSASERGLLGIALHPNFLLNPYVYLYWTESSTGVDSTNLADVALLGNRVDRYIWNGSTLTFDRNLIHLHAYQADANQPLRGNHNGGILRFGPDGKLYILMGDNGRRGLLQNNQLGPVPDDQFGGPEPDDAHLTGFILRLNDDGSTPADNPFFNASTPLTGEAAANIKKLFAYGVRNGFGLAFDPLSGNLWDQENGDDAFDEMNRVTAGSNNGWVEMMGPNSRVAQFKQIETTYGSGDLQQVRWPPSQIADTPAAALARLYMLPGAHYNDPEFSWKYAIPASPLGFVQGRGLGPQFEGDMFVGAARTFLVGGFLFRFKLTPDRLHFSFTDSRLNDLVADNLDKFDITESESLLIGRDFGITTDIETGPNGDLYIVSNTNSAVYEVSGKQPALFVASLNGAQETPPNNSTATGTATLLLSPDETTARVALNFSGLTSAQTNAHIHGPAAPGVAGNILFPLPNGSFSDFLISLSATDVQNLKSGQLYINVHSSNFLNGEIRGQFGASASASSVQFSSASYFVSEAAGRANITLTRIGDTSTAASVTYLTNDAAGLQNCNVFNGIASPRCDYINTLGTMTFAAGETFKTFSVPLVDDGYAEGNEGFTISLSNPSGAALGSPNTATVTVTDNETANGANPIDDTNFFVRQQYIDFLGREPDPPGFASWTSGINSCAPGDTSCDRIHVSQLFFQSAEFQARGYFVYRFYPVAFGRKPDYAEFVPDLASVSGFLTDPQLEAAKVAFIANFMARTAFVSAYSFPNTPTGNQQYVDALLNTAGVMLSSRQAMIDGLNNSSLTRAVVLRTIVESAEVSTKYNHQAYAVMEYFGYLRRQPDGAYLAWIAVLDGSNDPRGMVTGFVNSLEYRNRFGP